MSIGARMLVDVEQDTQSTTGDVIQFCAVDDNIAFSTLKYRCKTLLSLHAGRIVKVAFKGSHESSFLFVNRDIHILTVLTIYLFLHGQDVMSVDALISQTVGHLVQQDDAHTPWRTLVGWYR